MACVPSFTFVGKNGIQDEYAVDVLEGRKKSVEEILVRYLCPELLLRDGYSISEGANMEARAANGFFPGFLELQRQGSLSSPGNTVLKGIISKTLAQGGIENHITGESSDGYLLDADIPFVKAAGPEVEKRVTSAAELDGKSPIHIDELEGRAHGRESPGVKKFFLSAERRSKLLEEEFLLSVMNRKLQAEENVYSLYIENDCCKFTIQFGDNAAVVYVLEDHDSGASRFMDIQDNVQFPVQSKNIFRLKEDITDYHAKENNLSKLEKRWQHIDLSQKGLGEKCDDQYENVKIISGLENSSSISLERIFDFDLVGAGGHFRVSYNENSFTGEKASLRSYRDSKLEGGRTGTINNEDSCTSPAEGAPEGLFFVLPYLQVRELLAIEQVSRSLRDAVRNDILLWKSLHIEHPLSKKVTDDVLLRLTARAQGHLQCLSLLECVKVTEYAVRHVLVSNQMLLKLCLPGCTRVSADAVVAMVKEHIEGKSVNGPCLNQLRIRGLYGVTKEHVEQLHSMLLTADCEVRKPKPRYYRYGHYPAHCEDDRLIDVEVCPKCANIRVVYDCTRDRCQLKQALKLQQCRGCTFCIARCEECGTCIDDTEYEETFCMDLLCSACWLRLPKCIECNRPGCGKHVDHFIGSPDTIFLCADCHGSSPGEAAPEFYAP